ncbi:MAG: ABC transporter permease [Halanaerobiales bacterium]
MISYIVRRLLILPIILFGITLIIFGMMMMLSPYQRVSTYISGPEELRNIDIDDLVAKYGLDDPFHQQYGRWFSGVIRGDLGWSESAGMPVTQALASRFPATLELALFAILPVFLGGITLGVFSAVHHNDFWDHLTRVFAITGWSIPTFVAGLLILMIFYGVLGWTPPGRLSNWAGEIVRSAEFVRYTHLNFVDGILNLEWKVAGDAFRHIIAPVVTVSILWWAYILRITRSSMLETLRKDYIRTARSKGLKEKVVINKHARRNALVPVVTIAGPMLMGLMGGLVITEQVFAYRGLGRFTATAAQQLDYPAVLGSALYFGFLLVLANLAVDVSYAIIDPRIRLE